MHPEDRTPRRHLPTIATCLVIVWLAAVCIFTMTDDPASARDTGPERLIERALGSEQESERYEDRSRPVTIDIRATAAGTAAGPERPHEQQRHYDEKNKKGKERRDDKKGKREERPKRALGHTVPVAPRLVTDKDLREPHHDYPALDLPLNSGTRVVAVTSGRIKATTRWGGCGKGLVLRGRDRFTYTYCHGSKLLVSRGRHVKKGQGVMRSGNTGDSTGPHLHLQIRKPNGKLVCPQDLLPAWKKGVPASPWDATRIGCRSGGNAAARKGGKKR